MDIQEFEEEITDEILSEVSNETDDQQSETSDGTSEVPFVESVVEGIAVETFVEPIAPASRDSPIEEVLNNFVSELKENNRISQQREQVIDQLHQENQALKQGELQQALLPIFRDLIRFYDDLSSTLALYSHNPELASQKAIQDLSSYKETVVDILYRYGVEQIEAKPGEEFDSKIHKAVSTIAAEFREDDRTVARIVRDGFRTESRTVRNVEVMVFRYTTTSAPENEGPNQMPGSSVEENALEEDKDGLEAK